MMVSNGAIYRCGSVVDLEGARWQCRVHGCVPTVSGPLRGFTLLEGLPDLERQGIIAGLELGRLASLTGSQQQRSSPQPPTIGATKDNALLRRSPSGSTVRLKCRTNSGLHVAAPESSSASSTSSAARRRAAPGGGWAWPSLCCYLRGDLQCLVVERPHLRVNVLVVHRRLLCLGPGRPAAAGGVGRGGGDLAE